MVQTKRWTVDVMLFEEGDVTRAEAVLHTGASSAVRASGTARRNPADANIPEIGDELATARALSELAHHLFDVTVGDIQAAFGGPVHLHR